MQQYTMQPPQFPQAQPHIISEQQYKDGQPLMKPSKKKAAKGFLICLLALPILFFITCLILFIIMICYQHSNTVSVDHAISVTEQFGKDLRTPAWVDAGASAANCPASHQKYEFSEFQGINDGQVTKITAGKEYQEVDIEDECSGVCKKEKGIAEKKLTEVTKYGSPLVTHHLCYKTVDFGKYIFKNSDGNCDTGYQKCSGVNTQFCYKTAAGTEDANCPIVHLKEKASANGIFSSTKDIDTVAVAADKKAQIIIGMVGGFSRPCKNPEYLDAMPKSLNYPLLSIGYNQCDEYGSYDKLQTPDLYIGKLTYKTILEINGIDNTAATVSESPYFYDLIGNSDLSLKYNLYAKHRPNVKFDDVCQPEGMTKLGLVREYLNTTNRALFIYTLLGLVLSAIGILFWIAMIGATFTATHKKSKKGNQQILKVMHIVAIILAILLIIFYIHYFSVVDEDFAELEKTNNMFANADHASCYTDASDWKSAVDVVHGFLHTALEISKPFIITFFIIGIVYLALVLIVMAATKAKGVSPCYPPYLNYLH